MTNEELLEKAKKNYPVGTVFLSAYSNNKHTSKGVFEVNNEYDVVVDRISVYWKGNWAKIISRPEIKVEDKPSKDRPFYVVVTENNKDVLSKWRFNDTTNKLNTKQIVGLVKISTGPLRKGHNPITSNNEDFGNEITFEQFLDLYSEYKEFKPQFEIGKWYRSIMDGKIWYIKLEKYQKNRADGETISSNGTYWQKDYWSASPLLSSLTILTDLSEIQQYLPKDHPDLIPLKQDPMKELTELPEKWGIKITQENKEHLNKWRGSLSRSAGSTVDYSMIDGYLLNKSGDYTGYFVKDLSLYSTYSEITFDQFKRWVLKESDTFVKGDIVMSNNGDCLIVYPNENTSGIRVSMKTYVTHNTFAGCNGFRKATDEEKQWLQSCITAGKFISLADSKILTSSTVPEYVECIKQIYTNSNPKVGEIIKATSEGDLTGICIYNSITYKECFKPSTKEAYDAQFVKEEKSTDVIEQWIPQVGEWAVHTGGCSSLKKGESYLITFSGVHDGNYKIMTAELDKLYPTKNGWGWKNNFRKALPHEIPVLSIGKTVKVHVPFKLENGEWDMKAVQDECKKRYPIGCRFRTYSAHTLIKDSVVYSICGNQIYAHQMAGSLFDDGKWAELISLTESSHTMEHYIDQLPSHLKKKVKEIFNSQDIDLEEECNNIFDCINAFEWDDTCEGFDYWDTLNTLLEDDRDISNYGLAKTMSTDGLLEEAKRRYTIGTIFISEFNDKGKKRCIIPYFKDDTEMSFMSENGKDIRIANGIDCSDRGCSNPLVYSNGKWAEIVTESHDHKIIDVSVQPLSMTIPLLQPLLKV